MRVKKIYFLFSLVFFSLFFIYPVMSILVNQDADSLLKVLKDPYLKNVTGFTFKQAFLSAVISVIAGLPGAWIMKNCDFKGKKAVNSIYSIPFILPSIIVVLGFVTAYGKNGYLNKLLNTDFHLLYSFKTVIAAHVFYNFPIAVSVVSSYWKALDPDVENYARSTGLTKLQTFFRVTLIRLIPGITSALTIIFLYCFTSFAIILVLGGGPELTTLEVEIYRQARISLNRNMANAISLYSLTVSMVFIFVNSLTQKLKVKERPETAAICHSKPKSIMTAYLILSVFFIVFPITGIIIRALSPGFMKTLSANIGCIVFTVITSLSSAILAVFISLGICLGIRNSKHRNITETFFAMPLATSSVIIGLGYLMISFRFSFIPETLAVVFAHSIVAFPFCLKVILPALDKIPDSIRENARNLGASESYSFFHVEINAVRNEILTAFIFAFAISCGDINSTILLAGPDFTTLPVQIYRLINSYDYDAACTLGLILVILCITAESIKFKFADS